MRIGYHDYSLRFVDAIDGIDTSTVARVKFHSGRIKIQRNLPPAEFLNSLLHEVLHVVNGQHKLDLEEEEICTLAAGLTQFLRDNFPIVSYVIDLIGKVEKLEVGHEARLHDLAQGSLQKAAGGSKKHRRCGRLLRPRPRSSG